MAAIRGIFFAECEEQLEELEHGLMALEQGWAGAEVVNAVFRAVHSIKGGAGAFALDRLVRFAHVFETALDAMRTGRLAAEAAALGVMLRAADVLADLVRAERDGAGADEAAVAGMSAALGALCGGVAEEDGLAGLAFVPVPAAMAAADWLIRFAPEAALYANGSDAALLLRELAGLGGTEVRLDTAGLPVFEALDPGGAYLAWTIRMPGWVSEAAIREVFEFVEDECSLSIGIDTGVGAGADGAAEATMAALLRTLGGQVPEAAAAAALDQPAESVAGGNATIRVDLDRVDRLIDLVGELAITGAMLSQRVMEAGIARTSAAAVALEALGHLTRDIQDCVMAIRAQPVRGVFARMPRLVREVAAQTGKAVRLVTEGGGTEVDRTVIERLADPLTHMIRNAIDHGLETPAARAAAGKPDQGTVRLAAAHRSGRIVIEVADDGAGIDRERVRGKAVALGLVSGEAVLSDEEIDALIFLPGFSTAAAVSDISGRGVGMDVVRRSVQALGGRIGLVSRPGHGSVFSLSLPLTLAVMDGMVVTVAGQTLIVPIGAVVETLQPAAEAMHGMGRAVGLMALRGAFVPVLDVAVALGYRGEAVACARPLALLVEGDGGQRAMLLVDAIGGQRQVVIKSLEANYRAVPGIAAATVMGDGLVALILDVDALLAGLRGEGPRDRLAGVVVPAALCDAVA